MPLRWSWLLLALVSACDWFGSGQEPEPPRKTIRFADDAAYLSLVKEHMSRDRGQWDRYLSMGGNLVRTGQRFKVFAFLNQGVSTREMRSVLVLGRTDLAHGESPVVVMREVDGLVHELDLVRLGPAFDQQLVFTSIGRRVSGYQVIASAYWDVQADALGKWSFREVWKVSHAYDPDIPESYAPPDFHYWDVDDDGVQEIIVTNPWKGSPPPWRYRWSVFRWHPPTRRLVPLRGLALYPFREQEPDWLVWSVLDLQRLQRTDELVRTFATGPSCESSQALLQALSFFPGVPEGPPVVLSRDAQSCRIQADSAPRDGQHVRMEVGLVSDHSPFNTRWKICRIQLFRVRR
jgi:hypothetical protein